ncbi:MULTISPECIES: hydroxyisourate hydrolase [unclassified Paenibacillus]|uniref:hydroxyisourate hydrolase n=1 Tax=Paenibacillus TaxID=44249 RepID=UPI00157765DF|nr:MULTISPECIES: hydroxyisourate hydrolase [unclassified Paenibacillus]NTZ16765.1 hydroxyisourate hydrolase [Paenibacillus sp. JMULE4]
MKGGCLTTHVLDISSGRPAGGMKLELWRITANGTKERIRKIMTNTDGRPDAPLLEGEELTAGKYELVFAVGDYFVDLGTAAFDAGEPFLGEVPIRFGVQDPDKHYHVPLLVAPGGYSTYRGS